MLRVIMLLLITLYGFAQTDTEWGDTMPSKISAHRGAALAAANDYPTDMPFREIPIKVVSNVSAVTAESCVDVLNMSFRGHNGIPFRFVVDRTEGDGTIELGEIEYGNFVDFANIYRSPNSILIVCKDGITSGIGSREGGFLLLGDGFFDDITTGRGLADSGTLAHEIGHVIGLSHPFDGNTFAAQTNPQNVEDSENCEDVGDFLCGTEFTIYIDSENPHGMSIPCVWAEGTSLASASGRFRKSLGLGQAGCYYTPGGESDLYPPIVDAYLAANVGSTIGDIPIRTDNIMGYFYYQKWKFEEDQLGVMEYTINRIENEPFRKNWKRESIQRFIPTEMTVSGAGPKSVTWDRVTVDRFGKLAFPDYYMVHSKKSARGKWFYRGIVQAESSDGVFPATRTYSATVNDETWLITPVDSEAGWTYEATGGDADWVTYTGYDYGDALPLVGYLFREDQ